MLLIDGVVKNYDWGSTTAIPELLGRPVTGEPVAELWFGTHPAGLASVAGSARRLDEHIAAERVASLGRSAAEEFGSLPFLLKLMSAALPLSLQAHPSAAQARAGFDREESQGLDRYDMSRSFRDPHHKPELLCALSEFRVLCGFRGPAATLEFLDTIPTPALDPLRARLAAACSSAAAGISEVLRWLLGQDSQQTAALVASLVTACESESGAPMAAQRATLAELGRRYPRDPAVAVASLMHQVTLRPGESIFLGPGDLHAYLRGTGVELMASSDNVVRAGLTGKHVDRETLLAIVDTEPKPVDVARPEVVGSVARYRSPAREFSLQRIHLNGRVDVDPGPAILLCVSGEARCEGRAGEFALGPGAAAFMPACDGTAPLSGKATVFRAGLGPWPA